MQNSIFRIAIVSVIVGVLLGTVAMASASEENGFGEGFSISVSGASSQMVTVSDTANPVMAVAPATQQTKVTIAKPATKTVAKATKQTMKVAAKKVVKPATKVAVKKPAKVSTVKVAAAKTLPASNPR